MSQKKRYDEELRAAFASQDPFSPLKLVLRMGRDAALERMKALADGHAGSPGSTGPVVAPPPAKPSAIVPPVSVPVAVRQALSAGNKIEAIRLYRQHAGVGLKEAKEAVETLERQEGRDSSGLAPGEQPPARDWMWLVVILAVILAVGYYRYGR